MRTILIATTNQGKLEEISQIMKGFGLDGIATKSLNDVFIAEPDEPYDSFCENAQHKARYYGQQSGLATLCDDSGLCINALLGFPGVRTKDFGLESGSYAQAFINLEERLKSIEDKTCYFQTSLALYLPNYDKFITTTAKCSGRLSFPATGVNGFGYDPIFVPNGYDSSLAVLGPTVKSKISHRAQALSLLFQKIIHDAKLTEIL